MGEIFERATPQAALPWTGERLTTAVQGQVEVEHLHRYAFARGLVRGQDVLDIASGEGYGAAMLAQVARSVVGVDIDAATVAHAAAAYERPNLRFIPGDARRIPLPDASVDWVVSFETLEHFFDHDAFLAEVRRVLRPGGRLVVSTPDRDTYSPAQRAPNPFHVRERTGAEFAALLRGAFRHVALYGQRPFVGAALVSDTAGLPGPVITIERRDTTRFEVSEGLARPIYRVGIASDAAIDAPGVALFIEQADIDHVYNQVNEAGRAALSEAADLRAELHALRPQAEAWRVRLLAAVADGEALRTSLHAAKAEAEGHRQDMLDAATAKEALQAAAEAARSHGDGRAHEAEAHAAHHRTALAVADVRRETTEDQIRRWQDAVAAERAALHAVVAAHGAALARVQARLRAAYASTGWRLTGPLRGLAQRHPALAATTRGLAVRHPLLSRTLFLGLRSIWRLGRARPGAPLPEPALEVLPGLPAATPDASTPLPPHAMRARRNWLFLGDTLAWLDGGAALTGVGRVTAHLLFAAGDALPLCTMEAGSDVLTGLPGWETRAHVAVRTGRLVPPAPLPQRRPMAPGAPVPGDHVLFTGAVWTPEYTALMTRLAALGVRFSVLLYDIIPLEHPGFVSPGHHAAFAAWLRTVLALADAVFVPGHAVADEVLRRAALWDMAVAARVVPVRFGVDAPPRCSGPLPQGLVPGFVLCVGTIDARKNQVALCRAWAKLASMLPPGTCPPLVLAGRDDVGLVAQPGVTVLPGLTDAEVAALQAACLFTVFPSLAEGYGLPVAESLAHGKLCIASDLPTIREHAGDLPWYVPLGDEPALLDALHRAIAGPAQREAAEARIRLQPNPVPWSATWAQMQAPRQASRLPAPPLLPRPDPAGLPRPNVAATLDRARLWCTDDAPTVSILVVTWNAAPLTLECVRQVWAATEGVRYEIVLVDNGSDPASLAPLRQLGRGVRLLELGTNRFFGEANNIAAEAAQGRLLCLMNSDAFGRPGWLRALVDTLDADPAAGATGPVFLFPDGTVQEAGAYIDADGIPQRYRRGMARPAALAGPVDYISAATLLVRRDCFLAVGGFDLGYEPAYYEDADLCLKLAAIGRPVRLCPTAEVVHIEGASAGDDPVRLRQRAALGDTNRAKFTARWGTFLRSRDPHDRRRAAAPALPSTAALPTRPPPTRTAALFTPYPLTPGGGERVLLTAAAALARDHAVTLATAHPYSRLRLLNLGRELGIGVDHIALRTEAQLRAGPPPDLLLTLGNSIVPPLAPLGRDNVYLCQFPFPDADPNTAPPPDVAGYRLVLTYSDYVRAHVVAGLSAHGLPTWPVHVVAPPVPPFQGDPRHKRPMVLAVGRFFEGGHSKRHDALIAAFAQLLPRVPGLTLHLAGSATPAPGQMDYLDRLRTQAAGLPVTFHVNASHDQMARLYRDAAIYWHAAGLGAPLAARPYAAEHFGISITEAMSAGCVPLAFNAGGPREVVRDGVDGVLYADVETLVERTAALLLGDETVRFAMGDAAQARAALYTPDVFQARLRVLVLTGRTAGASPAAVGEAWARAG